MRDYEWDEMDEEMDEETELQEVQELLSQQNEQLKQRIDSLNRANREVERKQKRSTWTTCGLIVLFVVALFAGWISPKPVVEKQINEAVSQAAEEQLSTWEQNADGMAVALAADGFTATTYKTVSKGDSWTEFCETAGLNDGLTDFPMNIVSLVGDDAAYTFTFEDGLLVEKERTKYDESTSSTSSSYTNDRVANPKVNTSTAAPSTTSATTEAKQNTATVWIPQHGGKRYHRNSSCSGMKGPKEVTVDEAESKGFTPCGRCYG